MDVPPYSEQHEGSKQSQVIAVQIAAQDGQVSCKDMTSWGRGGGALEIAVYSVCGNSRREMAKLIFPPCPDMVHIHPIVLFTTGPIPPNRRPGMI